MAQHAVRRPAGIFDLGMPGLTGYELARYVRLEPWGREAVLIALSGFADDADRAKADHAGFTHYRAKPAEFADLSQLLPPAPRVNPGHAPGAKLAQACSEVTEIAAGNGCRCFFRDWICGLLIGRSDRPPEQHLRIVKTGICESVCGIVEIDALPHVRFAAFRGNDI